ncbi:MAG TPA: hypothetical protein EYP24_06065 [bacterium (Candidatus Stahlbacteria)]|nr:hypothetical protein [Candidatus Stahlbacteria bacterium]
MTRSNYKVIKIGGSILTGPTSFLRIAQGLLKRFHSGVVLITSAMKGRTDDLIQTFEKAIPMEDFWNYERFIGMGEIETAILFEAAFTSIRKEAKAILPWMEGWPIHISLKRSGTERRDFTILPRSRSSVKRSIKPLLQKGYVIVVPGFIAKDGRGRILTLGRGGSDISALIIGELLKTPEIIFIKDVAGVMTADPKFSRKSRVIPYLDSDKLGMITASGAKVLNPISLKHQRRVRRIKFISAEAKGLKSGTVIEFVSGVKVIPVRKRFAVLTFIGERIPQTTGILYEIAKALKSEGISIYSISLSDNIVAVYVVERIAEKTYRLLIPLIDKIKNLKVINLKKGIGKIVVRSLRFIDEPGVIKRIVTPIAKAGINIWEILTVHTDIMVYVEWKDLIPTVEIVRRIFQRG